MFSEVSPDQPRQCGDKDVFAVPLNDQNTTGEKQIRLCDVKKAFEEAVIGFFESGSSFDKRECFSTLNHHQIIEFDC